MKSHLSLILFLIAGSLFGQNRYNVDSLNQVLTTTKNDSVKIKTLQWIFDNYLYSNSDSTQFCYNEMFKIGKESKSDYAYYNAYLYKATYYWTISKMDSVVDAMEGALKHALRLKDDAKESNSYVRLAMAQSSLGNYSASKELTYKALEVAKRTNDWEGLYYAYYKLGNLYLLENEYNLALKNYLKVDSIFENKVREEPALAGSLHSIGSIYMKYGNYEKAEEYYQLSRKVYVDMKRIQGEKLIDYMLGEVALRKGNFSEAIQLFLPSYSYFEKAGDMTEASKIADLIGQAYIELKEFKEAEKYFILESSNAIKSKNKYNESQAYLGMAEVAKSLKNPLKRLSYLNKAWALYEEMNITYNKTEVLKNLADSYEAIGNFNEANRYLKTYQKLKDSLIAKENFSNFQELETKYQTEKKEQEIALLTSQNELVEQQKKNQRNLLLGGIGLTSLVGIFFFFLYRNRQKTTKKLKEIDNLKSNFFANISHEFRTPLTLISAPLEKKLDSNKLSKTDRADFEMMQRNSSRLLNLVDQLLDLSKLESGNLKLSVTKGNLTSVLKSLTSSFKYLASQKNINYTVAIEESNNVLFDKNVIEKTIINLLSNAFKYTPDEGIIQFNSIIDDDQIVITVENSGSTLSKDKIEQLFNRFYQADETTEGVGIGLSLVKELVTLSHGTISVANTPNNTIEFKVTLPITAHKFSEDEIIVDERTETISNGYERQNSVASESNEETEIAIDKDLPILLIVEDNTDVRNFVRQSFSKAYQVIEAPNGKVGIAKALEYVPDIIISDIMMPETDGLTLCKELKQDECTSHIPIILLTAKVGEEDQYKGLETGADDYVTKPFKIKLLETRVQNLVASRKLLRDRYSQEVVLKPKDIAITNLDEQFLERIEAVLDKKLTESSFSVEEFSKAVGLSRMQLHRKLKALTDLSASEFIRSQRLKLAASLLQKSDANISEIGYMVGFNDPAYFSKCFKEAYGCSPSEYSSK